MALLLGRSPVAFPHARMCCYTGDPRALDWRPSNHIQMAPSMSLMSPSNSSPLSA